MSETPVEYVCRLVKLGKAAEELMENPPEDTTYRDNEHAFDEGFNAGYEWATQRWQQSLKAALEGDDD
jgi:hypothetical protein